MARRACDRERESYCEEGAEGAEDAGDAGDAEGRRSCLCGSCAHAWGFLRLLLVRRRVRGRKRVAQA